LGRASFALLLSLILTSCPIAPPYYTLTLAASPDGSGTVSPESGSVYQAGSEVTLTATPTNGWVFEKWEGDLISEKNPATILLDSDRSVTARFVQSPPPTPTGLTITVLSSTSLMVAWDVVQGATGYQVFRSTSPAGPFTNQVYSDAVNSFTDTLLSIGASYHYKVQATNANGSSPLSAYRSGTTPLGDPPAAPTGLNTGSITYSSVALSWNASATATGYTVLRDTAPDGPYSASVNLGNVLSYTYSGLSGSTTYYFKVKAKNVYGSGAPSDYVSATTAPSPPATPTGLSTSNPTVHTLNVSWNPSPGATGYRLYRFTPMAGEDPTIWFDGMCSLVYDGPDPSTLDLSLPGDAVSYYKVTAYSADGESPRSALASGTTSLGAVSISFYLDSVYKSYRESYTDASYVTSGSPPYYSVIDGWFYDASVGYRRVNFYILILGYAPGTYTAGAGVTFGLNPRHSSTSCSVTISQYGAVGGQIIGTFSATLDDGSTITSGSFNVLRY
jgi:hypothetical protein